MWPSAPQMASFILDIGSDCSCSFVSKEPQANQTTADLRRGEKVPPSLPLPAASPWLDSQPRVGEMPRTHAFLLRLVSLAVSTLVRCSPPVSQASAAPRGLCVPSPVSPMISCVVGNNSTSQLCLFGDDCNLHLHPLNQKRGN